MTADRLETLADHSEMTADRPEMIADRSEMTSADIVSTNLAKE